MKKIPMLLQFFITVIVAYGIFKAPGVLMGKPIPSSLILMYMFFAIVMTLLVITSTEKGMRELIAPIKALVHDPGKKTARNIIFALVPLIAAYVTTYDLIRPSSESPVELRSTHPAPPSILKAFGKTYNMNTLTNPYRKFQRRTPSSSKNSSGKGGRLFQELFLLPRRQTRRQRPLRAGLQPAAFTLSGKDTIAQLQESFVFWRISTGGPGFKGVHPVALCHADMEGDTHRG